MISTTDPIEMAAAVWEAASSGNAEQMMAFLAAQIAEADPPITAQEMPAFLVRAGWQTGFAVACAMMTDGNLFSVRVPPDPGKN